MGTNDKYALTQVQELIKNADVLITRDLDKETVVDRELLRESLAYLGFIIEMEILKLDECSQS